MSVVKQALLRLLHQTKPSNKLYDPTHPDFDAQLVLKNQMRLREEPFVKILSYFRQWGSSHPFIPERCAALGQWVLSAEFQYIMERSTHATPDRMLVITSIQVNGIPQVDTAVPLVETGKGDPFVVLTHAGAISKTKHVTDRVDATWADLDMRIPYSESAGVILELFDHNAAFPNSFIGSCLLAIPCRLGTGTVEAPVRMDVLSPSTIVDRPSAAIQYRIEAIR